jgi:predicted acyl esterase
MLFQGRRDFAFDIDQATAAYRALAGPKHLYIGDFGHSPSTFPGPDVGYLLGRGLAWYDRFLKGMPNGIDSGKPVEIAPDPWKGKAVSYATMPRVRQLRLTSPGTSSIGARGKAVRTWTVRSTGEQFGAPVVHVIASSRTQWPHLVAVLTRVNADRSETVLSDGGAATTVGPTPRSISFKLIADANLIPKGAKLRLYLGATSTVQNVGNLLYLLPVPDGSQLTVRKVGLTLPLLPKTISR